MRHIKTYKVFESVSKISREEMKDILVDITDNDINIDIYSTDMDDETIYLELSRYLNDGMIDNKGSFKYQTIENNITHFISYMNDHGYNTTEVIFLDEDLEIYRSIDIAKASNYKWEIHKITFKFSKLK